jgi:hypothetical protein
MILDFDFECNARSWFDVIREGGRRCEEEEDRTWCAPGSTAPGAHLVQPHLMRTQFDRTWYLL